MADSRVDIKIQSKNSKRGLQGWGNGVEGAITTNAEQDRMTGEVGLENGNGQWSI